MSKNFALVVGVLFAVVASAQAEVVFRETYGTWSAECNNARGTMGCGLYSIAEEQASLSKSSLTYALFALSASQPVVAQLSGDKGIDWRNTKIFYHLDITFPQNPHSTTPTIPGTHQAQLGCKDIHENSCTLNMVVANDMSLYISGGEVQFTLVQSNTPRIYKFDLTGFAQALKAVQGAMQKYLP